MITKLHVTKSTQICKKKRLLWEKSVVDITDDLVYH